MLLDFTDCLFSGPALPEPFIKFELEKELRAHAKTTLNISNNYNISMVC